MKPKQRKANGNRPQAEARKLMQFPHRSEMPRYLRSFRDYITFKLAGGLDTPPTVTTTGCIPMAAPAGT